MTNTTLNTAAATATMTAGNDDGDVSVSGVTRDEMNAVMGGVKAKNVAETTILPAVLAIPLLIASAAFIPLSLILMGKVVSVEGYFHWGNMMSTTNMALIAAWMVSVVGLLFPEATMVSTAVPAPIRWVLSGVLFVGGFVNSMVAIFATYILGLVWVVLFAMGMGANNGVLDVNDPAAVTFMATTVFVAVCAVFTLKVNKS